MEIINRWGGDIAGRIKAFIANGKMLRGCLVMLSYNMFKKNTTTEVVKTALAMELFHSAFLIHDDIMDSDFIRRGKKSIFYQYKLMGDREKLNETMHFGESMGICAGDVLIFLAYEILGSLKIKSAIKEGILGLFSGELINVGLAQMQDIYSGLSGKKISIQELLKLYNYKTARYTFVLPMMAGAILAGQSGLAVKELSEIGELVGVIFQIKDDELGQFGTEKEIGKSVGSDIKEGKKTLYYLLLRENLIPEKIKILDRIYGNRNIGRQEIKIINSLMEKNRIREKVNSYLDVLCDRVEYKIRCSKISRDFKDLLLEILYYNLDRKK